MEFLAQTVTFFFIDCYCVFVAETDQIQTQFSRSLSLRALTKTINQSIREC